MKRRTSDRERKYYDALDDLLDQPIAFNPAFLRIVNAWVLDKAQSEGKRYGNAVAPAAAIFLSQAWYWSKRTNDPDGWFWKSAKEWEQETGLTDNTQSSCRKLLGVDGMAVIEEKLKGVPATVNYRVCRNRVHEYLGFQFPDPQETEYPDPQEAGIPTPGEQVTSGTGNLNTENTTKITQRNNISDASRIWEQVFEAIKPNLKGNHLTYVRGVKPISIDGGVLTLGACDELTRLWLQDRLTSTVNRLLIGILDTDTAGVVFEVQS